MDDDITDLTTLLAALRQTGQEPDAALLQRVKAFGTAAIAPLIRMATDEGLHFADGESPEVWAPLHAIRLLGELEAAEAVGPLLPLFSWTEDDWLPLALPEAFGRIGKPALMPLRILLADHAQDSIARSLAGSGLKEIAARHPDLRTVVLDALTAQLDAAEPATPDEEVVNGFIVGELLDLDAREALPAIERAFEGHRVDVSIAGDWNDVRRHFGLVPVGGRSAPVVAKVGRNDPCPCGSGKKYKKCHGQ